MNKSKFFIVVFVILVGFISMLSAQNRLVTATEADTILVEFAGKTITTRDLRNKLETFPAGQRERFKTVNGQKQVLEMMITEEIFYKKALELGIDQREDVQQAIREGIKPVARNIYLQQLMDRDINITSQDIERHYNENIESFTTPPFVTIQHLSADSENVEEINTEIANGTELVQLIERFQPMTIQGKTMVQSETLDSLVIYPALAEI